MSNILQITELFDKDDDYDMKTRLKSLLYVHTINIKNLKHLKCCFVWVWNLIVDIAGGKKAEGV